STMCTQRSCSIVSASIRRQLDNKSCAPCCYRLPPETARVPLNDPSAQVQPEPHPSRLCGLIGVKNVVRELRSHTPAIVLDPDHDRIAICGNAHGHAASAVRPLCGGVNRIGDEIDEDLLNLDPVRLYRRDETHIFDLDQNTARGRFLPTKRAYLFG